MSNNEKEQLYLIGAVDSLGVPYTRDNKDRINHLKVVYDYLLNDFEVIMLDLYSIGAYNTTDYINDFLNNDITYKKVKENQCEAMDECRKHGITMALQLSKKAKEYYHHNDNDDLIIRDVLKTKKCVFIFSSGVNDLFALTGLNMNIVYNPWKLLKVFPLYKDIILEKIRKSLMEIIAVKPSIEIYVLGLFFPTRYSFYRKVFERAIIEFNEGLQEICNKLPNVFYVDNTNMGKETMAPFDVHPNALGQKVMGDNIINVIKESSNLLKLM